MMCPCAAKSRPSRRAQVSQPASKHTSCAMWPVPLARTCAGVMQHGELGGGARIDAKVAVAGQCLLRKGVCTRGKLTWADVRQHSMCQMAKRLWLSSASHAGRPRSCGKQRVACTLGLQLMAWHPDRVHSGQQREVPTARATHLELVQEGLVGGPGELALRIQHSQHTQTPAVRRGWGWG